MAGGFLVDSEAFALHLLAEIVGLIAGAFAGVFVVDRLTERTRAERWRLVAQGTRQTLRSAIVMAALPLYMHLPAPRPPTGDPVTMDSSGDLPEALRNIARELEQLGPFEIRVTAGESLAEIEPHVRLVLEVVLPRLLLIGVRPDLVAPLVDLEGSLSDLQYHVSLEGRFGLPREAVRDNLVSILKDLEAVARAIQLPDSS
jgi:hypothetical protein